jgi:hypothetical protein
MYTVEKDRELWLILKAGAPHITVKSESLARAIAAMLNAFAEAEAGAGIRESVSPAESRLLPPGVAQEKAKGLGEGT